jgi:hypothetical protein
MAAIYSAEYIRQHLPAWEAAAKGKLKLKDSIPKLLAKEEKAKLECDYCHSKKERMTTWQHTSGEILHLCFKGCQFFGEPYRDANPSGEGNWTRIDEFQKPKTEKKSRKSKPPAEATPGKHLKTLFDYFPVKP